MPRARAIPQPITCSARPVERILPLVTICAILAAPSGGARLAAEIAIVKAPEVVDIWPVETWMPATTIVVTADAVANATMVTATGPVRPATITTDNAAVTDPAIPAAVPMALRFSFAVRP